jgi:hypothetical protein
MHGHANCISRSPAFYPAIAIWSRLPATKLVRAAADCRVCCACPQVLIGHTRITHCITAPYLLCDAMAKKRAVQGEQIAALGPHGEKQRVVL